LTDLGIPTVVYEPAEHSFWCQVEAFANARGIVGWRGAEFANLMWCPPSVPVVMFQYRDMHGADPPQQRLAELLGIPMTVVSRSGANFTIDAAEVFPYLTADEGVV